MNLVRAMRAPLAMLAVLALCSCAQPTPTPPASEPSQSISRIRVVNDSAVAMEDLELLFPEDEVAIGDVTAGATSEYVEVPRGVYNYSAFRFTHDGESVLQPVIDFVGERPLPIDDYTYLLGVDPDSADRLVLRTVFRAAPTVGGATHDDALWVRVSNQGPDDLTGYTMRFSDDQQIYLGSIPAGTTSQYTRRYAGSPHALVAVTYTADGTTVRQGVPSSGATARPTGTPETGTYTYVVGYDASAPMGEQVEQRDVVVDAAP